jgi:hypothetical protein
VNGITAALAFVKYAGTRDLTRTFSKVIAGGAKKVLHHSGEAGAGIAEGLGAKPGGAGAITGRLLGQASAVGAAGAVGAEGKRKVDEFRFRHGLYRGY